MNPFLRTAFVLGAACLGLSACENASTATSSGDACADSAYAATIDTSGTGPAVFAVASDYSTYEVQRTQGSKTFAGIEITGAAGGGVALDAADGVLYVMNQNTGSLKAYRGGVIDDAHAVFNVNLGISSDPYQVLKLGNRLFVDRWKRNNILVLDAATGDSVRGIDLSASANDQGAVGAARMAFAGGKLWIAAERMRADNSYDSGMVIAVDTGSAAAPRGIALPTRNPIDLAVLDGKLYVACHGTWDATANGGIERIDLATVKWEATITGRLSEKKPINSLVAVGGRLWTVIALDAYGNTASAVPVDPASGAYGAAAGCSSQAWRLVSDGTRLWLADHSAGDRQALLRLDPATGTTLSRAKTELPADAMAVMP